MIKPPSKEYKSKSLVSNEVTNLQGVALYHDDQKSKFRLSVSVYGDERSFEQCWKEDKKNSNTRTLASEFSRLPSAKPSNANKGSWDGVFQNDLTMFNTLDLILMETMYVKQSVRMVYLSGVVGQ